MASLSRRLLTALGIVAGLSPAAGGCQLITAVDERRIHEVKDKPPVMPEDAGAGDAGPECVADADCKGPSRQCGRPRCFHDGRCGFDNEPIGALCTEGG